MLTSLTAEPAPVKVLIITGQNNHKWPQTTAELKEVLEETQRFEVSVTRNIEKLAPAKLKDYDVIVSNWNLYRHRRGIPEHLQWSEELRAAYIDFVKNGGGHVAFHAGTSTFYEWEDYQKVGIATWRNGTTHGPSHTFEVRMEEVEHPVTAGLGNFKMWDELWQKLDVADKDAQVLTSSYCAKEYKGRDVWEPSTFVGQFGEGRTAYTSFGHEVRSFEKPQLRVLFARLIEWAATGEVTIPAPESAAE